MHIPKQYFHDRLVLLTLTVSVFLAVLNSILILLKLDSDRGDSYIVEYRANLGVSAFSSGSGATFMSFILFSILVVGLSLVLSMRIYQHRRYYALVILGMGVFLLSLAFIVSNALLVLR